MHSESANLYRFDDYEMDPRARVLSRAGEPVVLTRRAFDLLLYLVQHPGQQLNKDELIKNVWPDAFVDENSLAKSISVLRKALNETAVQPYIVTLAGRGYQFARPVVIVEGKAEQNTAAIIPSDTEMTASQPTNSVIPSTPIAAQLPTAEKSKWLLITLAVVLLLAVAVGSCILWWQHAHPAPQSVKVVVADFENATGDKDLEFALKSAFQIDLEQTPFLNIVSHSSVAETLEEMQHKRDESLTPALATEVCVRNNAQATLTGSISRIGEHYLLFVEAYRCIDGQSLGGFKEQAASKSDILHALDAATGHLRKELGESRDSLGSYQTPIAQATTNSLDALSAYSEAIDDSDRGDVFVAETLFERAIQLDPNFASAYKDLGILYRSRGDFPKSHSYLIKAYDLRAHTTERERLAIEIAYNNHGIDDWETAIVDMQLYNRIYPNDAAMWYSLCRTYNELGLAPQAILAGEHAYQLAPNSGEGIENLMRAYRRAGRFADAKRVAASAIAAGKDRWGIHSTLYQIAFLEHDTQEMEVQSEWGLTHQEASHALLEIGFTSASQGKLRDARVYFARARNEALRNGDADFADDISMFLAGILIEYGDPTGAKASLNQMRSDAEDPPTTAYFRALLGDIHPAERVITQVNNANIKSTLTLYFDLPQLRSVMALHNHWPAKAVDDLEPARKYQLRDWGVPYQCAWAESEAGMLDKAAADYRLILDNSGIQPLWPAYTLSHLRLARVLVHQKKLAEARTEYETFLTAWKDGDPELPLLVAAKAEYAKLKAQ
jgi:eukaryotic-like serine/threonine-protein kinase